MDWPAYSPDLNSIEHVWDTLGRRIAARLHHSENTQQKQMLIEEWVLLSQEMLHQLVLTLTARPAVPRSRETQFFFKDTTIVVPRHSPAVTLVIKREGGDLEPATIFMETFDNTAKVGVDYRRVKGNVQFGENEVEVHVPIKLIDNPGRHGFEFFHARILSPSTGTVVLGKNMLTVFIESESRIGVGQGFDTPGSGTGASISASFGPNIRSDSQIVATHTKSKNIMTGGFDSNLKVDSNTPFLTDQRVASSGGVLTSGTKTVSTLGSLTSGLFSSGSGSISAGFSGSGPISTGISGSRPISTGLSRTSGLPSRPSGQTITSTGISSGFQTQGTSPIREGIFQNDNTHIYVARLDEHKDFVKNLLLPAQSPNLTIIELLWSILERSIRYRYPLPASHTLNFPNISVIQYSSKHYYEALA
ncbi:uncharacterized protein TNCV_3604931 [Trichonephila clavipes]|nr:uncharacterized protein TNCV_3604931 [Trichonephila clavipes]